VAVVFGDMQAVRQILGIAEQGDDDRCLIQLEKDAEQVVALYRRGIAETQQAGPDNLPPREDDLW
jgi:hypothetical protein